jgi:phosphoribosylformylglycinamidine synthase
MGGSHYNMVNGLTGGEVPQVDFDQAPKIFRALYEAIRRGLIVSCHDVSEGGIAAALAEMCIAGGLGAQVELGSPRAGSSLFRPGQEQLALFSESNSRFLIETSALPESLREGITADRGDVPCLCLGQVTAEPRLTVRQMESATTLIDQSVAALKEAWQRPLRW